MIPAPTTPHEAEALMGARVSDLTQDRTRLVFPDAEGGSDANR